MDVKRGILATVGALLFSIAWLLICITFGYQGNSADFALIIIVVTTVGGILSYYFLGKNG